MVKHYSANNEFKTLAQSLGFTHAIFDDIRYGKEITLREQSKNQEIDAVASFKNIICLVAITESVNPNKVENEIVKYFHGLDKVNDYDDKELVIISTGTSPKSNIKTRQAERKLQDIKKEVRENSRSRKQLLRKIFFCPKARIPQEFILEKRREGEIIIDKDIYDYFIAVVLRLGKEYLRYDFFSFVNIRKSDFGKIRQGKPAMPGQNSPVTCTKLEVDNNITLYSVIPSIEEIKEYVTVLRIAGKYDEKAFQRMVKSNRLEKINKDYLNRNQTFPNNIIVALNPEVYIDEDDFYNSRTERFKFYDEYNSLFIIDGQHRFYSFVYGNKIDRQIITTLLHFKHKKVAKSYLEMSKMFYDINKKSEKIDPNLAFNILAKIDTSSEQNFWFRVFDWLMRNNSLFKNNFTFHETTLKESDKKSIISVIQYGGILNLNSQLKKGIVVEGLNVFYKGLKRDQQIVFAGTLLDNYFDILETVLHKNKIDQDDISPREIGALCRLLRQFMIDSKAHVKSLGEKKNIKKLGDADSKAAVKYFEDIFDSIDFEAVMELDISSSNWAAVEGFMLSEIQNSDSSFGNIKLLSKKGLELFIKRTETKEDESQPAAMTVQ